MEIAKFFVGTGIAVVYLYLKKSKLSSVKRYSCSNDSTGDCPCHSLEKTLPPPVPKDTKPIKVTIEAGKAVYTCTCGQSKNFPYCDGSHKAYNAANNTKYTPLAVKNEGTEPKDAWLCACGHSKQRGTTGLCDGSHKNLHVV